MAGKYNYHHQHKEASDTCISTKKTALNTEPSTMQLTNTTFKKSYIKYNSPSKKTTTKLMQQQKNMQNKQFCFTEMVHYFMKYKSTDCTFLGI